MLPNEILANLKSRSKLLLVSPLAVLAVIGMWQLPWGAATAPAWVQAIGSVGAILAAWIIPYGHDLRREARQREAFMRTIRYIASRQVDLFDRMIEAMVDRDVLMRWQVSNDQRDWEVHAKLVNEFPLAGVDGFDFSLLVGLREGADYGLSCCQVVLDWPPSISEPYRDGALKDARIVRSRAAAVSEL